jgi:ABC-type transport system involved in multi-copper enzyme maturation permease subunit
MQYHKQRNNTQQLQQYGLEKYNRKVVYRNDLKDTTNRLNRNQKISTENKAKKMSLILGAILVLLAILFLIFYFISTGGLATFWLILCILCFIAGIGLIIFAFVLTKKHYAKQMRDRRAFIRNYLRAENDRYYHKRGLHWKPSRECSYLILKNSYSPAKHDEELWLTGRNRPDILPWGQVSQK